MNRNEPQKSVPRDDGEAGMTKRGATWFVILVLSFYLFTAVWIVFFRAMIISRVPTAESGAMNLRHLKWFWIGSGAMWVVLTALFIAARKYDVKFSKTRFARTALLILISAIVIRGVVVGMHQPGLSDDIWRYVLDGEVSASGHNPYVVAPKEVKHDNERYEGEYALAIRVNHPELVTIYLPVSEVIFALSAKMNDWWSGSEGRTRVDPDRAAFVFRLVMIAFEIGTMVLLALVLFSMKRSAWYLAMYAWHPLAISEFAGEGHQDAIGICLMVCALAIWHFRPKSVVRFSGLVALAGLVKPITIPIVAIALHHGRRSFGKWVWSAIVGVIVCSAFLVPYLVYPNSLGGERLLGTIDVFLYKWAFFGSVYEPLLSFTGDELWSRRICSGLLLIVWLVLLVRRSEPWRGSLVFLFVAALVSTTVWPWYLLWALVLFPIRPSASLWIATLTIPWGYVVLGDVVRWTVSPWVMWLTYVPIYAVLIVEIWWLFLKQRKVGGRDRSNE